MFDEYLNFLCWKIMNLCPSHCDYSKCTLHHSDYIITGLSNLVSPYRIVTLADFQGRV